MGSFSPRGWLQRAYLHALMRHSKDLNQPDLGRSALVFAPHQDDETLACGGTIMRKRAAGAEIKLVFMTDGRSSHAQLMPAAELVTLRKTEALAAAQVLGLTPDDVFFLDFADGWLATQRRTAIAQVAALLRTHQPAEVFIPYFDEPPADHYVTNQVVLAALVENQQNVTVYEYPVWFWHHWPWVSLRQPTRQETKAVAQNTLTTRLGGRLLQDFRHHVYVSELLARKEQALAQHASQMERLRSDSHWPTLHDVADGDFLRCFFTDYEHFYVYEFEGSRHTHLTAPQQVTATHFLQAEELTQ